MIVARYFLVGGAASIVDIGVFALLVKLVGLHWFVSALMSFVLGTLVNYQLSIRFVFTQGVRFQRRQEIGLVFLASGVGLAFNQLALFIAHEKFGIDVLIAKLFATGAVFFWNFGARRFYIFRG